MNDFVLPTGKLFVKEAPSCIPHCQKLIESARARGAAVFWVIREHDPSAITHVLYTLQFCTGKSNPEQDRPTQNYSLPNWDDVELTRRSLYVDAPGETAPVVPGSFGAQLVEGLEPAQHEQTIIKKRFSAFFQTHLDMVLRRKQIKTVIICGVQTPNCIRASAFDGISLDYHIIVPSDATASASQQVQDANLYDLKQVGVKVMSTEQLLSGWDSHFK